MTSTHSPHAASLTNGTVVEESELGLITRVTADTFPILRGLSIKRVLINPGAMRTPHWHANANELTYCVSGAALARCITSRTSAPTRRSSSSRSVTNAPRTSGSPRSSAR